MGAILAATDKNLIPPAKQVALPAGVPINDEFIYGEHIFVIEEGVVGTFVKSRKSGRVSEVGMIGIEGMFPLGSLLRLQLPTDYLVVPQLGILKAHLIERSLFLDWVGDSEQVRRLFDQYLYFQLIEKNSTIACMDQQGVEERISRVLLMCHDRTFGDILTITHEDVAQMISSYRPTVTNCVHNLEDQGAIKLSRGQIEILDRNLLKDICGHTYGYAERFYRENIAPFGK
jgi:CRP-like cAMP-binding protein